MVGTDLEVTCYTVSDSRYFLGTVLLLNSLRLTNGDVRLVVLDRGLTSEQRSRLEEHADVVDIRVEDDQMSDWVRSNLGYYLKPYPAFLDPKGIVIALDSDVIVTDSLKEPVSYAAAGKTCVWEDLGSDRWFAEWQHIFSLDAMRASSHTWAQDLWRHRLHIGRTCSNDGGISVPGFKAAMRPQASRIRTPLTPCSRQTSPRAQSLPCPRTEWGGRRLIRWWSRIRLGCVARSEARGRCSFITTPDSVSRSRGSVVHGCTCAGAPSSSSCLGCSSAMTLRSACLLGKRPSGFDRASSDALSSSRCRSLIDWGGS